MTAIHLGWPREPNTSPIAVALPIDGAGHRSAPSAPPHQPPGLDADMGAPEADVLGNPGDLQERRPAGRFPSASCAARGIGSRRIEGRKRHAETHPEMVKEARRVDVAGPEGHSIELAGIE